MPIARTKAGREYQEALVARKRENMKSSKEQKEAATRASQIMRCSQSNAFWCRIDPNGDTRCCRVYQKEKALKEHIKSGKHVEGAIRPWSAGVAVGRGTARDRDIAAVQQALTEHVTQRGGKGAVEQLELVPAFEFHVRYANDQDYEQDPAEQGWARAQRLPVVRSTIAQLEFIVEAFTVGDTFNMVKLSPADARQVMQDAGTAKVVSRFKGHPYFGVDLGKPRFKRSEILDEPKIKAYFGQGKSTLKQKLANALKRGSVDEDDEADESADDGEGEGAPRRRKKRQKRRAGAQDTSDRLASARAKLAAFDNDIDQATAGRTRKHLSTKELKALLVDAGQSGGGKLDSLQARARQHKTLLVSRVQAAATCTPAAGPAGEGAECVTAAAATPPAGAASVAHRAFRMEDLRTARLPVGLALAAAKATKLAAVWATCGALADASDSDLRAAIMNGRLPSIGLPWLRRLHAALAHLATSAQQAQQAEVDADAVVAGALQVAGSDEPMLEDAALDAAEEEESGSNSDSESDSSSDDSELGSAVGTDADNSSTDGDSSEHED